MKKGVPFEWYLPDSTASIIFDETSVRPKKGKPLLLYITALDGSFGALLAQRNEQGKENALY
jgi:hypothetical protein